MLYITQLIYIREGQEAVFEQFEAVVIPLISKYGGKLLLRSRITPDTMIDGTAERPHEVHVVTFPDEAAFQAFLHDQTRKQWLHLKEAAIRSVVLVKGHAL